MWPTQEIEVHLNEAVIEKMANGNIYSLPKKKDKWSTMKPVNLNYKFSEKILDLIKNYKIKKYIDYGCGDAMISKEIQKIHSSKLYCVDINEVSGVEFVNNESPETINKYFENESIDLISMLQSFHHVQFLKDIEPEKILNDLIDKLKPGGLFLMREHDVNDREQLNAVITEHIVYESTETDEPLKDWINKYNKNNPAWYFSRKELHRILNGRLKLLHSEYKKGKNLTRIYNSIYVKKEDYEEIHVGIERNNTNTPLFISNMLKNVDKTEDVLQYHQKLVKQYFINYPNHRGLLVFHGTGTGKTMLSVSIADVMKDDRRVIILSAKSLQYNFIKEIEKYMTLLKVPQDDITKTIENRYNFISSNAGNMLEQLSKSSKSKEEIEFEKTLDSFNKKIDLEGSLIIIDEAQNLFNGIVNGSKNAIGLYKAIMDATDIKIVFLSATPIINDPFEIVPLFNMLHGSILLSEDYDDFYNYFVDVENNNVKNKEKLKNRIYGLTSYMGDWWQTGGITKKDQIIKRKLFPDQLPTIVEYIHMSPAQFSVYTAARDMESKVKQAKATVKESMQKPKSEPGSTYRVASRQISNFLLPESIKIKNIDKYGFTKYIDLLTNEQLTNLDIYSPKMKKILENVEKHIGISVVYSAFVSGEGLKVFSKVLLANGWIEYNHNKKKPITEKCFVIVSGDVSAEERIEILKEFNKKENKDGDLINMMLLSGAGAEGLDLKNVRSIHIMEPYWNYGRIQQIIARAVRYKSHEDFEHQEDKTVQPYIYLSDYPENYQFKPTVTKKKQEKTTDVHLYTKSIRSKLLIDRFYAVIIESSIDCSMHIQNAPVEVQEKINCVICAPTDENLFNPNIDLDLKMENPCRKPDTYKVKANEIEYDGTTYYYTKSQNGIINLYEYKKEMDSYVELNRSHYAYNELIDTINR